jgi:prepilin-type processing-associated H-X9-DG protein
MTLRTGRRAFTLLEIFVVLGIIAMFLALLVPFFLRMREGGRSGQCVLNMQRIGKAIQAYAKENEGRLPGPLTMDQYPAVSAGNPPREGQLLKHIGRYLQQPANSADGAGDAKTIFTFPAWQRSSDRTTDAPVFMINNDIVQSAGQPAWGADGKPALTLDQLQDWKRRVGEREEKVELSKMWALTEADQELAKILGLKEPWVPRVPPKALHMSHRNALYFDWHVDTLALPSGSVK